MSQIHVLFFLSFNIKCVYTLYSVIKTAEWAISTSEYRQLSLEQNTWWFPGENSTKAHHHLTTRSVINSSTSFFIPSDRKSNHSHSKTVGLSVCNQLIHSISLSTWPSQSAGCTVTDTARQQAVHSHSFSLSLPVSHSVRKFFFFLPRMHIIHCSRSVSRIYLCPPSPPTVTADASILYLYDNGRPRLKALRTEQSDLQLPSRVLKVPALG